MKIYISESAAKRGSTVFYPVPLAIFDIIKNRNFSDADNKEAMAVFRGKGNEGYLIKKEINSAIFKVYALKELKKRGPSGILYELTEAGVAVFDVNYNEKHITGYSSNESIKVVQEHRRRGVATAIIDFAENYYGMPYKPSKVLSTDMSALVKDRFNQ